MGKTLNLNEKVNSLLAQREKKIQALKKIDNSLEVWEERGEKLGDQRLKAKMAISKIDKDLQGLKEGVQVLANLDLSTLDSIEDGSKVADAEGEIDYSLEDTKEPEEIQEDEAEPLVTMEVVDVEEPVQADDFFAEEADVA